MVQLSLHLGQKKQKRKKQNIRNHPKKNLSHYIIVKQTVSITLLVSRKTVFDRTVATEVIKMVLKRFKKAERCFCKLQTLLTLCLKSSILKYRHQSLQRFYANEL